MTLKKQQLQVLRTVQFQAREATWSHKTLRLLRTLGLVESTSPYSGAIYRWTITDAGRKLLQA